MRLLAMLLCLLPRGNGQLDGIYRAAGPKYITFFPDARVFEGIPDGGMDGLDEDAEIRFHSTGWGTYTTDGTTGQITFGPTIVWNFHVYPDRVEIHGDRYQKLESGDGVKLAGTFRRADAKTVAAAQQGITFMPNGRFKDEGIFKAAFVQHRTSHGYEFDDGAPGTGTYRVRHYSLELTYDNGRSKRAVFYLDPNNSGFWFNEYRFARVP
jgi:hypothetical protein